ncbi:MAG: hypothetical protein HQM14_08375 [SAR324 cluster bacterium]|nr:hypothetical protein [SAR324 cluster bacterium]
MKLAFELSFYVFLFLFIFGMFLLIWFFRWIFGEKDILSIFPHTREIPSPTMNEALLLFKKMKEQVSNSTSNRRARLAGDMDTMDRLLEEIEFRTKNQRAKYHQLCKDREETWHYLKDLVEGMSTWERTFGKKKNFEYSQGVQHYKDLEQRIERAAQHISFREELLLAEVRDREIFRLNYSMLHSSKGNASTE